MDMKMKPEFTEALDRHQHLVNTLGMDHPITKQVFQIVMEHAPDEFLDLAHDVAKEMDLIPAATGYLEDGTAMYRLDDIAEKLGMSIDEAEQAMRDIQAERKAAGLPELPVVDGSLIHRVQ
jgi:AraC-like DNA-binding protein